MRETIQNDLLLPIRATNDVLAERLADAVECFNATTEPAERVELIAEIRRLRVEIAGRWHS